MKKIIIGLLICVGFSRVHAGGGDAAVGGLFGGMAGGMMGSAIMSRSSSGGGDDGGSRRRANEALDAVADLRRDVRDEVTKVYNRLDGVEKHAEDTLRDFEDVKSIANDLKAAVNRLEHRLNKLEGVSTPAEKPAESAQLQVQEKGSGKTFEPSQLSARQEREIEDEVED